MTKVKIFEHKIIEKTIDLEYPFYLYFQGDDNDDEIVKVEENYQISIKRSLCEVEIKRGSGFRIEEEFLNGKMTSKELFYEIMYEAIELIKKTD